MDNIEALRYRIAPLEMTESEFRLNVEPVTRLQRSGEAFLSNAVIGGTFLLRACIVNFRTALEDIEALPGIVIRVGREVDATIRPGALKQKERNIR